MESIQLGQNDLSSLGLDKEWSSVLSDYEIIRKLSDGSYSQVIKAKNRRTGQLCAIKFIKDVFENEEHAKNVCRELKVMRHLSREKNNIYTPNLLDVIIPIKDKNTDSGFKRLQTINDRTNLDKIMIVQEYFGSDISSFVAKHD